MACRNCKVKGHNALTCKLPIGDRLTAEEIKAGGICMRCGVYAKERDPIFFGPSGNWCYDCDIEEGA